MRASICIFPAEHFDKLHLGTVGRTIPAALCAASQDPFVLTDLLESPKGFCLHALEPVIFTIIGIKIRKMLRYSLVGLQ